MAASKSYPAITKLCRQLLAAGGTFDSVCADWLARLGPVPVVGAVSDEMVASGEVWPHDGTGYIAAGALVRARKMPAGDAALIADRLAYFAAVEFVYAYRSRGSRMFEIRPGMIGRTIKQQDHITPGRYEVIRYGMNHQSRDTLHPEPAVTVRRIIPMTRDEAGDKDGWELSEVDGVLCERNPATLEWEPCEDAEPAAEYTYGETRSRIRATLFNFEPTTRGLFDGFTHSDDFNALLAGCAMNRDQPFALSIMADYIQERGFYFPTCRTYADRGICLAAFADHVRKLGMKPAYRARITESKAVKAANRRPASF